MSEGLWLESYSDTSKRHAIVEDNGLTAWFYLHEPSNDPGRTNPVERDGFVYNRETPIDPGEVKKYRPHPPPIAKGYASAAAVCADPGKHEWAIVWSKDGESVRLEKDGVPWCLIASGEARGYSKAIEADGPWGHPWSDDRLGEIDW